MTDDTLVGTIESGIEAIVSSDTWPVVRAHRTQTRPWYTRPWYYEDDLYTPGSTDNKLLVEQLSLRAHELFDERYAFDTETTQGLELLDEMRRDTEKRKYTPEEDAHEEACMLLSQCLHRKNRTREKMERAVTLIEQHYLSNFTHYVRGLVCFPDLLDRFLAVQKAKGATISDDDLGCMFARCIEHGPDDTYGLDSIKHLLTFKGERKLEIKLLPRKYKIDSELYELVHQQNVQDSYYDATENCECFVYTHMDVVAKEQSGEYGQYTGFRDAYHCLLYGDDRHLQALIVRWDLWGDDCTADAAREFFDLEKGCPIHVVTARVSQRCEL